MPRWTAEARDRQRQLILATRPWERSTGPTSAAGKRRSARNSLKTGEHTATAKLERTLIRLLGIDLSLPEIPDDEPDTSVTRQEWEEFFRDIDENELFKSN